MRFHEHAFLPKRREDAPAVDELEALGHDVDFLRHNGVAEWIRLRRGGRLAWLLRYGTFLDADQRLAVRAIQDIREARLSHFRDALA